MDETLKSPYQDIQVLAEQYLRNSASLPELARALGAAMMSAKTPEQIEDLRDFFDQTRPTIRPFVFGSGEVVLGGLLSGLSEALSNTEAEETSRD